MFIMVYGRFIHGCFASRHAALDISATGVLAMDVSATNIDCGLIQIDYTVLFS